MLSWRERAVGWAGKGSGAEAAALSLTRIVIVLAAVAVGYFIFSAVGDTLLSHQLTQDEQQLQRADRPALRGSRTTSQAMRDYLQTDEYVEGVARRVLGLVRPGETLFIVCSDASTPTPGARPPATPDATPEPWWERLYGP